MADDGKRSKKIKITKDQPQSARGLEQVLGLNNDRRKEILIYTFGLSKKDVFKMKKDELQSKIREFWRHENADDNN